MISGKRVYPNIVAKEYIQTYGVDYMETFSPVARLNSVRIRISEAINKAYVSAGYQECFFTR